MNFGAFDSIADRIRKIPKNISQIARRSAIEFRHEIEQNFARGVDQDGRPWTPLALTTLQRGRRPPPLTDTGTMRRTLEVLSEDRPGESRISIRVRAPYASRHQLGTSRVPVRTFWPRSKMPIRWREILIRLLREIG